MKALFRTLLGLYLAAIGVLCFADFGGLSASPSILFGLPADKVVHFLMFAPYPVLMLLSFHGLRSRSRLVLVAFSGLFLAGCTELIQYFIPYRECNLMDLLADGIGIAASSLAILKLTDKTV